MSNNTLEILKKAGQLVKEGKDFKIPDETEFIGVYFSAHWCPPCRGFTPTLADFYKKHTEKPFEIVFVSSDRDKESFDGYFGEMPWAALKFEHREDKETLGNLNSVRGIPTFIVFNKDGTVNTSDGRSAVSKATGDDFPFKC